MNDHMYEVYMQNKILSLRKAHDMTQEQLANQLGVSYQAVSKWENGQACPDIMTLPELARIFGVSIDALFYEEETMEEVMEDKTYQEDYTWADDDVYHVVLFKGHRLIEDYTSEEKDFTVHIDQVLSQVDCHLNLSCEKIEGPVNAGGSIASEDITGHVTAGGHVACEAVSGDVQAGGSVTCEDVAGNVSAGATVTCENIGHNATAGLHLTCEQVGNNVSAGNDVTCEDVGNNIDAGNNVTCEDVRGNVRAGGRVDCEKIGGRILS